MSAAAARAAACLLACSVLTSAAADAPADISQLPDLKRGQAAAANGDVAGAERDLVPLAQMGYPQAQISLANLYAQSEDPATIRKAVNWFKKAEKDNPQVAVPLARALLKLDEPDSFAEALRFLYEADKKGDPRALAALIEFYTDHPERDDKGALPGLIARAERDDKDKVVVEPALLRWYRANPQTPRNAEQLAQRCGKALDRIPECYVDLARYHRARHQTGDMKTLLARARKRYEGGQLAPLIIERAAWSLCSDNLPGEPQPDLAYPLLKRVMNTSISAQVHVARLQVEYPHLDPEANPEQVLLAAVAQGSDEAALALGRLYIAGNRVVADPEKAQKYLEMAAPTQPGANYFLGRMYKRGENGVADPLKAAQYLLTAARGGYVRADFLLAQLFSDYRGTRPNKGYALMFANLAAKNGVAEGAQLATDLKAQMTPAELQRADALLVAESATRVPVAGPGTAQAQGQAPPQPQAANGVAP